MVGLLLAQVVVLTDSSNAQHTYIFSPGEPVYALGTDAVVWVHRSWTPEGDTNSLYRGFVKLHWTYNGSNWAFVDTLNYKFFGEGPDSAFSGARFPSALYAGNRPLALWTEAKIESGGWSYNRVAICNSGTQGDTCLGHGLVVRAAAVPLGDVVLVFTRTDGTLIEAGVYDPRDDRFLSWDELQDGAEFVDAVGEGDTAYVVYLDYGEGFCYRKVWWDGIRLRAGNPVRLKFSDYRYPDGTQLFFYGDADATVKWGKVYLAYTLGRCMPFDTSCERFPPLSKALFVSTEDRLCTLMVFLPGTEDYLWSVQIASPANWKPELFVAWLQTDHIDTTVGLASYDPWFTMGNGDNWHTPRPLRETPDVNECYLRVSDRFYSYNYDWPWFKVWFTYAYDPHGKRDLYYEAWNSHVISPTYLDLAYVDTTYLPVAEPRESPGYAFEGGALVLWGLQPGSRLSVYDAAGRLVLRKRLSSGEARVSLAALKPGVYIFRVGSLQGKFVAAE